MGFGGGGEIGGKRGIRWKAWDHLCVPKQWGGLGFRRLREFNLAMLSKQAWNLIQNPNSLVGRVYRARYYQNTDFLNARKGNNPYFIRSSLLETQEIILRHSRWRVGDGTTIRILEDRWLPDKVNPFVSTNPYPYLEAATVSSLKNAQDTGWDEDVISDIFNERDAKLILSIPLAMCSRKDKLIWTKEEVENSLSEAAIELLARNSQEMIL